MAATEDTRTSSQGKAGPKATDLVIDVAFRDVLHGAWIAPLHGHVEQVGSVMLSIFCPWIESIPCGLG